MTGQKDGRPDQFVNVGHTAHRGVGLELLCFQQKAFIARWISRSPKVFMLDVPTRGIDMGARAAIYETIVTLAREGMAVIVVSSDLEEVKMTAKRQCQEK